jgi:hypothetical protein
MHGQVLPRAALGALSLAVFGVGALLLRDWALLALGLVPVAALEWFLQHP